MSDIIKLSGTIKVISEVKTFEPSGFRKREVVLTTDDQYPQHVLIEFVQEKCDLVDGFQVGEQAEISINIRGREWTSPEGVVKYFNTIQGWRIDRASGQNTGQQAPPPQQAQTPPPQASNTATQSSGEATSKSWAEQDQDDDLPF